MNLWAIRTARLSLKPSPELRSLLNFHLMLTRRRALRLPDHHHLVKSITISQQAHAVNAGALALAELPSPADGTYLAYLTHCALRQILPTPMRTRCRSKHSQTNRRWHHPLCPSLKVMNGKENTKIKNMLFCLEGRILPHSMKETM